MRGISGTTDSEDSADSLGGFANNVPTPMQWPGERYETSKKQPWFFGAD